MSGPELLIFDCDGVLIDSEFVACRIWAEELTRVGLPVEPAELMRQVGVRGTREIMEGLARRHGREPPPDFREIFLKTYRAALDSELAPIPGIADALARLPQRKCVASNSALLHLERYLAAAGIIAHFEGNLFSAEMVAKAKPAPDLFLHALQAMGGRAETSLVIEDSPRGVIAARAAGLRAIGFTGARHIHDGHAELLAEAGALAVIATIDQLPDLIARL